MLVLKDSIFRIDTYHCFVAIWNKGSHLPIQWLTNKLPITFIVLFYYKILLKNLLTNNLGNNESSSHRDTSYTTAIHYFDLKIFGPLREYNKLSYQSVLVNVISCLIMCHKVCKNINTICMPRKTTISSAKTIPSKKHRGRNTILCHLLRLKVLRFS